MTRETRLEKKNEDARYRDAEKENNKHNHRGGREEKKKREITLHPPMNGHGLKQYSFHGHDPTRMGQQRDFPNVV